MRANAAKFEAKRPIRQFRPRTAVFLAGFWSWGFVRLVCLALCCYLLFLTLTPEVSSVVLLRIYIYIYVLRM